MAPVYAALASKYAELHFDSVSSNRFIALIGDAELDEGNVWETVAEEAIRGLNNVIWIVDLNRQSLDRVIPGVRAARLKALFPPLAGVSSKPNMAAGCRPPWMGRTAVPCGGASMK